MTDEELIGVLEELRGTMIAVATGGPRIADVNERYQQAFAALETELAERDIDNPIRYRDLWDWYGRWSTGDLPAGTPGPVLRSTRAARSTRQYEET